MLPLTEVLSPNLDLDIDVILTSGECFLFFELESDVLSVIVFLYVGPSPLDIFSTSMVDFMSTLGENAIPEQYFSTASIAPPSFSLALYCDVITPKCGMMVDVE